MQELGFVSQNMATGYVHDLNINFTVIFPEQTAKGYFVHVERKQTFLYFSVFLFFTFKSDFAWSISEIFCNENLELYKANPV